MKNICAYQRRHGRVSVKQKQLLRSSPYLLANRSLSWLDALPKSSSIICELGFGNGERLINEATNHPQCQFIGIDLYPQGVAQTLHKISQQQLQNIFILQNDAQDLLRHLCAKRKFSAIEIFHPDPWPKKRHHKRRLLNNSFIHQCMQRIEQHGYLRIVTDDPSYQLALLHLLESLPFNLEHKINVPPTTKYGHIAIKEKRSIQEFTLNHWAISASDLSL